jgi:hypothetical protein
MDFTSDLWPPITANVGSPEPSHLWALRPAVDDDGSIVGTGRRQYSYWADCECPGDCLRDHENE